MAQSSRYRSRLYAQQRSKLLAPGAARGLGILPGINKTAHRYHHSYLTLVYTTTKTLNTTAGSPLNPPFAGRMASVRANCSTAPTTGLVYDILADGVSMFHTSTKPTIPTGLLIGNAFTPDRRSFQVDTKLQIQVTTVGGAGGPLEVTLEFEPAYKD